MAQPIDELKKVRTEKLKKLRELGVNPYPASIIKDCTVIEAIKNTGKKVATAGRVMSKRGHGGILFLDLNDETGTIQTVFKSDLLNKKKFDLLELVDIADFLAVQGKIGKTQSGEISVFVEDFQIITKALLPLPDQWYGLKDIEERYRKRYLDTLLNPEVKKRLEVRSKVVDAFRDFLTDRGFIEVETPRLQVIPGGATAEPFKTRYNALVKKMDLA